jgi:ABC-2 type transport system ATP-binding protein
MLQSARRSEFEPESMLPPCVSADRCWPANGRGAPRLARTEQPGILMVSDKTAGPPALDVDRVGHRYGPQIALDDVSLSVMPASFTVLLGLNGAGKSTLFSLITRLYAIRSGSIRILGHDIMREPGAALSRLGVVFQSRALDADISVQQNLKYHAALHGIGRKQADIEIARVLDLVAMTDRLRDRVNTLSGGQMRRVEIARALLHRPKLLLLDEPTVGLDIKSRADILGHVRRLLTAESIGVLWATHLIDEVGDDDDVVVLHQGRVLAKDTVRNVVAASAASNMASAFTKLTQCAGTEAAGIAK